MLLTDDTRTNLHGLAERQAVERLRVEGYNELPSTRQRGILAIALDVAREPMLLLLLAAGGIYLILGERTEASSASASVLVIIGITLYQERKTERALAALRDLSSPRALVIRDGQQRRIAGREVARGDLIVHDLFGFAVLHLNDLSICLAAGLASITWFEAIKLIRGKWLTQRSHQ